MIQNELPDVIIIDDDSFSNMLCQKVIELTIGDIPVVTFTDPQMGLINISDTCGTGSNKEAVLFLDINMPLLSGWDVLDRIANFPEAVRSNLRIFMLSSSVDQNDKIRSESNPLVSGYISKPLSSLKLKNLFPEFFPADPS